MQIKTWLWLDQALDVLFGNPVPSNSSSTICYNLPAGDCWCSLKQWVWQEFGEGGEVMYFLLKGEAMYIC